MTYSGDKWWCPLHCQVHLCKNKQFDNHKSELLIKRELNNLHDELNYFILFANNCQKCWKDDLIVYHYTYCLWQGQRQGALQYHQQLLLHRSGELFFLMLIYSSVCYFYFYIFMICNICLVSPFNHLGSGGLWDKSLPAPFTEESPC